MTLEMKYGDENEMTIVFVFLPFLDKLFCNMVVPFDLSEEAAFSYDSLASVVQFLDFMFS